ncbi:hypothetical protein JL193_11870 [Polaribacter batillariae]|uniref:Restriction endonuclease n=1 Tax=Polaribacter batillariae TaxID=2808900 RepID=A0ABX7SRG7_9FLAO|nr:hypothetical protein [Polaribacter batillariae]QTD36827.1 hypothetical protein JL193_11870 [Polaribacter batillariae]
MAGTLATSVFLNFQSKFEKRCISLFIDAFQTSISNQSIELSFDENDITAILHNFIDENPKRKKWEISTNVENHFFDKTTTPEKGFAAKFSRIDMRLTSISWLKNEYIYYIEAKNLKSKDSDSKRRYINTGIDNFLIGGKYHQCKGLLVGYILEGTINQCVEQGVNKLLKKDKRETEVIFNIENIIYQSNHTNRNLKHLFFDFVN